MELEGKVALIAGAGSGIGKAAALLMAREGAKIGALSDTESEVKQTVSEIEDQEGEALPLVADVSQPDQVRHAVEMTLGRWGRLDVEFANAGINGVWAPLEELSPEEWDRTLDVNLKGTFLTIKYAAPALKKRGGSIIITSSVNGTRVFSNTGATAYSASKAGQVALAKMVALELAPAKVRVNVICPCWIKTNIGENSEQRNLDAVRIPVEYP